MSHFYIAMKHGGSYANKHGIGSSPQDCNNQTHNATYYTNIPTHHSLPHQQSHSIVIHLPLHYDNHNLYYLLFYYHNLYDTKHNDSTNRKHDRQCVTAKHQDTCPGHLHPYTQKEGHNILPVMAWCGPLVPGNSTSTCTI